MRDIEPLPSTKKRFQIPTAVLAIIAVAGLIFSTGSFTWALLVNKVDIVHDKGQLVEMAAPFVNGYKENYAYYYTNPEYFDSLVWESSPQQEDRTRANDDGTLGEFGLRYYVAHNDSGYGQKIANLQVGDHITIDDIEYVIDDRSITSAGASTRGIVNMTGNADVILLTCTEEKPTIGMKQTEHVVWGHCVNPAKLSDTKHWV